MVVEQIVDIPANHRITLDVPRTVPEGRTILTFTPASNTKIGEIGVADSNRKPLSCHYGTLKGMWNEDAVTYQRKLRDEWD